MTQSHASRKIPLFDAPLFQVQLLDWYARTRRHLPWRSGPEQVADPYHVWLSEIMLQQTTVQAVIPYFEKFTAQWPTVKELAAADPDDIMRAWAGLGYYARARNLLKCAAQICVAYNGVFPRTEDELLSLPGIGPYTAAAISAIAFGNAATVVDGNIERIVSRVFLVTDPLPTAKREIREKARILFQGTSVPGDFAQALMDLGATVCIPQSPRCDLCPVNDFCAARAKGVQESLPTRLPKKTKPRREGTVFWLLTKDGRIVTEKRADTRMLGGMPGLPTSDWDVAGQEFRPTEKILAALRNGGTVYHSFTHFDLTLNIMEAMIDIKDLPPTGGWMFIDRSDIKDAGFPSLFGKVVKFKGAGSDIS